MMIRYPAMAKLPQTSIVSRLPQFARHLCLELKNKTNPEQLRRAMAQVPKLTQAFAREFPDACISSTVAISPKAWDVMYSDPCPELTPFPEVQLKRETIKPTVTDIFLHVCSDRFDLAVELSLSILQWFKQNTELKEEVIGYRYFGSRDLTGFSGHTKEELTKEEKTKYAIINHPDSIEDGGSYVSIQRYTFDMQRWQDLAISSQEEVMGKDKRTGADIEPDKEDMPHTHRVKTAGNIDLVRAGMPYGDAREQGHFFISYANKADSFARILNAMTQCDEFGHSDPLLRYAKPVTGSSLFAPSIDFLIQHSL